MSRAAETICVKFFCVCKHVFTSLGQIGVGVLGYMVNIFLFVRNCLLQ